MALLYDHKKKMDFGGHVVTSTISELVGPEAHEMAQ